jgi:hypothetical protein
MVGYEPTGRRNCDYTFHVVAELKTVTKTDQGQQDHVSARETLFENSQPRARYRFLLDNARALHVREKGHTAIHEPIHSTVHVTNPLWSITYGHCSDLLIRESESIRTC